MADVTVNDLEGQEKDAWDLWKSTYKKDDKDFNEFIASHEWVVGSVEYRKSHSAESKSDEIVIEATPNDNNGAATNDNADWKTLELKDVSQNSEAKFEKKDDKNYRITGEPSLEEIKAFCDSLPPKSQINLGEGLSLDTKAMMIAALGKDRIKNYDALKIDVENKVDGYKNEIDKINNLNANEQPSKGTPQLEETDSAGINDEQPTPTPTPASQVFDNKEQGNNQTGTKSASEPVKDQYTDDDLKYFTKSAIKAYNNWDVKNKSVNEFFKKQKFKKYKEIVDDIKKNGPHSRWQSLNMAIEENRAVKKEYKMKEGLVSDLLVAHANAEFQSMRREQLTDKKTLESQIDALEKNHPNKFAKYRKMYEEKYISSEKGKDNYIKMDYEKRTETLKKLMVSDLLTSRKGYLKLDEKQSKPSWREKYKAIRADEKPIRKARRVEKWKKIGKAVLNVITWPARKTWDGIQAVGDGITKIPSRIKQARLNRLNKKIDKKIGDAKSADQLSKRKIRQILRLQGRLKKEPEGKRIGIGDRIKIAQQVRGNSQEMNEIDVNKIIQDRNNNR